jgi:hypothetical protein
LFERYASLDPTVVQVLGADRLMPAPLHVVRSGGRP